jgi:hypothetical protein
MPLERARVDFGYPARCVEAAGSQTRRMDSGNLFPQRAIAADRRRRSDDLPAPMTSGRLFAKGRTDRI